MVISVLCEELLGSSIGGLILLSAALSLPLALLFYFLFFLSFCQGLFVFLLCSLAAGLVDVHGGGWQAMLPLLSPGRGPVRRPALFRAVVFVVADFRGAVWPLA